MPRNVELYISMSSKNDASGNNASIIYKCDVLQHPEETLLRSTNTLALANASKYYRKELSPQECCIRII